MSETNKLPSIESTPDIRIMRLKGDKTRESKGSNVVYRVLFELSATPSIAWTNIFKMVWQGLNPMSASGLRLEANVDRGFLVIRCPLQEIAGVHLPVLKKAVAATNTRYRE
jgi:hypothetical protein